MKEDKFLSIIFIVDKILSKESELRIIELINHMSGEFLNFEIVIVNNNSFYSFDSIKNVNNKVSIINLSYRHSMERAIAAGVDLSIGDFILEVYDYNLFNKNHFDNIYSFTSEFDFVFLENKNKSFAIKFLNFLMKKQYKNLKNNIITSPIAIWSSRRGQNKLASQGINIINRSLAYLLTGLNRKIIYLRSKSNIYSVNDLIHLFLDSTIFYTNYLSKFTILISIILLPLGLLIFYFFSLSYDSFLIILLLIFLSQIIMILFSILFKYLHHILYSSLGFKNYSYINIERK